MAIYALGELEPRIHVTAWVAPTANLVGQVVLEERVSVWFGTTIRADHEVIRVGAGSNVQENCVFHIDSGFPLTIGKDCTIGHKAMLHGCTVGNESLIGMGATILNGARIGNNCIVGAGALISEDKDIPNGSLVVGIPGRIVRYLDSDSLCQLKKSAEHYQHQMKRYNQGLRQIR